MRIDIHHHHHIDGDSEERLAKRVNAITRRLRQSNDALESAIDEAVPNGAQRRRRPQRQEISSMSTGDLEQAFANLEAEASRNTELDSSAANLFTQLADQIEQAKGDPARVQAIADALRNSNDALAAAIVANTPAAPGGEGGTPA